MTDDAPGYVELQVTSHFSFLRGASSPEELFAAAALLGLPALGVVDRNSVAGIVRAWDAEKTTGVRAIIGCRLDLVDGTALLVYPTDRAAYGRMCRLLSVGKARAGKGACHFDWSDVEQWQEGLPDGSVLLGTTTGSGDGQVSPVSGCFYSIFRRRIARHRPAKSG